MSILTGVSLSPNPSNGEALLQFDREAEDALVYVHDMLGKLLLDQRVNDSYLRLDLRRQPKGVYLVTVRFRDGQTETLRMIVSE
jgi:hypothetical protein